MNSSLDTIKNVLKSKRIRILFHPDQANYLSSILTPDKYSIYLSISNVLTDLEYTFSSINNKSKYDSETGVSQIAIALDRLVENGDYSFITNHGNPALPQPRSALYNLNIKRNDIDFFLKIYLNSIRNIYPEYS